MWLVWLNRATEFPAASYAIVENNSFFTRKPKERAAGHILTKGTTLVKIKLFQNNHSKETMMVIFTYYTMVLEINHL